MTKKRRKTAAKGRKVKMKRAKQHATKGRKVKGKDMPADRGQYSHIGSQVEFAVRHVEEALANLPPGTLSEPQAEDIRRESAGLRCWKKREGPGEGPLCRAWSSRATPYHVSA